ncbi:helix-turn-helix domain-containing protein [Sphaerisporangium sp. NPDC051011]|uniref:TetR/AcrR family transcriptional regulator n=1 Tax=Sphaerisporangium sp. NPDC051011 TaxID=3155792 RepID=UPI0033F52A24
MSRWQPDARERLERAALELFAEQGFAATTVPQIAGRAGLTTRTFFRHFADKREVLFGSDEMFLQAAVLIAEAPPDADPAALITGALTAFAATHLEGRRAEIRRRQEIIRSDEGLRERNLRKRDAVSDAVRDALTRRGLPAVTAAMLAGTSATLFSVALQEWLDSDDDRTLAGIMLDGMQALRTALGSVPAPAPAATQRP